MSVLPGYRLALTFQDGTSCIADLSAVHTARDCGVYEWLKDAACFEQARIELGGVTWPNGADLDPAWMYEQISVKKAYSVRI